MKKLLLIIVLALSFFACQKEELDSERFVGTFTLKQNGDDWYGKVYKNPFQKTPGFADLSLAKGIKNKKSIAATLRFNNVPLNPGDYEIDSLIYNPQDSLLSASFSTTIGGDAGGDRYYSPNNTPENRLIVESYNSATQELIANFTVFLVNGRRIKSDPSLPDTLRFTEGKIWVKLDQD